MSSWPWMKGVDVAIADPTPPVNGEDSRPAVKDLIQLHRVNIDVVATELAKDPLYDAKKHDDLWIVRFLISQKKVKAAIKAAKSTLVFRKEHDLDRDLRAFIPGKVHENPDNHRAMNATNNFLKYCSNDAIQFGLPHPDRGVVAFLVNGSYDQHALVKNIAAEDWLPGIVYVSEWSHQWLDYITRTSGRLSKTIRLVDLDGVHLSGVNLGLHQRDGAAMGKMEDCYPQMLQTLFICNAPSWMQIPWRILRPTLPKRVVQKLDFMSPAKNENERKRLYKYLEEDLLPTRYGGKYETWPVAYPIPETR